MFFGGRRSALLAATVAAAIAMSAGCGDSDDDGDGNESAKTKVSQTAADAPQPGEATDLTGEAAEIQSIYDEFVANVYGTDPGSACEALSAAARERFGGKSPCETAMKNLSDNEGLSKNRPYLTKVRVKANAQRALAEAKVKTSKTHPVPFVLQDGEWKIDGGF